MAHQYSQYIENVAGVRVSEADIKRKFGTAFARMSQQHPNYGKATNLDIEQWWQMIISDVFAGWNVPYYAFSGLYSHLNSTQPYYVYGDAMGLFKALNQRNKKGDGEDEIKAAILTNSDPRMRDILNDLLFKVLPNQPTDIPCFISYETGHEKPHGAAFADIEDYAEKQIGPRATDTQCLWHVGDHVHKDYNGALKAGWNAVLVDRMGTHTDEKQAIKQECTSVYEDPTMTAGVYNGRARVYVQDMMRLLDLWKL